MFVEPIVKNMKKLELSFSEEELQKFDNALDLLYNKGYQQEIKFQPPKQIGYFLIQYCIVRASEDLQNPKFGDIMVKLVQREGGTKLGFSKPTPDGLQEIHIKEILNLPNFE